MVLFSLFAIISMLISSALAVLALFLGKKTTKAREKLSVFECGFDPLKKARTPFSLRFFLVALIFLIFDVEIVLLLPLGLVSPLTDLFSLALASLFLILILILGLIHEWIQGALHWL